MMVTVMIYVMAVTCLITAAALAAERICAELRWPRRGVWLAALTASVALPAYSLLLDRPAPNAEPAPVAVQAPAQATTGADAGASEAATSTPSNWSARLQRIDWLAWSEWPDWRPMNKPLVGAWAAASATLLLLYSLAWLGLRRAMRAWPTAQLDGTPVLVSEQIGPALLGVLAPRIVVPRWLLDAARPTLAMVMRHEREHAAAKDTLLLVVALLSIALVPWNVALWWQLRRLRLAIEIDCDERVVRRGADAVAYSEVLLEVKQRRAGRALAAVALTEPVSQLERRIRLVTRRRSRRRLHVIGLSALAAASLLAAACTVQSPAVEVPRARNAAVEPAATQRQPVTDLLVGGERTVILVEVSASMAGRTAAEVERLGALPPREQRRTPKWRQLVDTVRGLTGNIADGSQFQVIAFNADAHALVAGTDGEWLTADQRRIDAADRALRERTPQGPSSLHAAFAAAGALQPPPDNIYLVVDGLPTAGPPGEDGVDGEAPTEQERSRLFADAVDQVPSGAPVNVILLPMEDEPLAAPAYWTLALRTGGSLLAPSPDAGRALFGGMPTDSDHLVFVVDTSGSMRQYAWDELIRRVDETIDLYPSLQGVQVVSDEGEYLLERYRGEWITDIDAQKDAILEAMAEWTAFSDSDPSEGIIAALDALREPNMNIALYVLGDDFARGSLDDVLRRVDEANRANEPGMRKARIHALAFPVYYRVAEELLSAATYASLMREISQRNGGTFVALTSCSRCGPTRDRPSAPE